MDNIRSIILLSAFALAAGCNSQIGDMPSGSLVPTDSSDSHHQTPPLGEKSPPGDPSDGGNDSGIAGQTPLEPPTGGSGIEPAVFTAPLSQIRLLSAHEYRNTVSDLLGVEASENLSYGDRSSGFDTSAGTNLDENLLSVLLNEAEDVASRYLAQKISTDFSCVGATTPPLNACFREIIDTLAPKAFRRPLTAPMQERLIAFANRAMNNDADSGLQTLIVRILMAPQFLYRIEHGKKDKNTEPKKELDPFEKASLISYSLTGSMPDEPLWADAKNDALDATRIRGHVQRLLATDRGRDRLTDFFKQWLRVEELNHMAESPQDFSKFSSAQQARSLRDEFHAFVQHVVLEEKGSFVDLLTKNVTYANRHTAPLYGKNSTKSRLERLDLDGNQRGGILTLASVLAVHASSTEVARDKPIHRGLLIKEQLLCEFVGLPAGIDLTAAAEAVIDETIDFEALTTRNQLELVMQQGEVCMNCHATFMPFGYLSSHFDALGQHQQTFNGTALDSRTDVHLGGTARGYADIASFLPDLASSTQVSECFTTQLMRYITGNVSGGAVSYLSRQLPTEADGTNNFRIVELIENAFLSEELYLKE